MYKYAALLIGVQYIFIGVVWFFEPMFVLTLWGLGAPSEALIVERRLGIVLTHIGIMFLLSRNAGPCLARSAISYGVIAGTLMVFLIGLRDLAAGHGGSGVLPGVGMNAIMLLVFVLIEWRAYRDKKRGSHEGRV